MDITFTPITLPDLSMRTRTSTELSLVIIPCICAGSFGCAARIGSADEELLVTSSGETEVCGSSD